MLSTDLMVLTIVTKSLLIVVREGFGWLRAFRVRASSLSGCAVSDFVFNRFQDAVNIGAVAQWLARCAGDP